ncbi:MAG: hypothetical protein ACP6IY_19270 [Promethearchaeia archaeon]
MKIITELICDISNIASFNKRNSYAKIEYIDLLFSTIPSEVKIIGIADCSLYHQINDKIRYKKDYLIPKLILEAPAGVSADIFILKYAIERDALILSNDGFSEYKFIPTGWLELHQIKFMIINNLLIFDKPISSILKNNQSMEMETISVDKLINRNEIEV